MSNNWLLEFLSLAVRDIGTVIWFLMIAKLFKYNLDNWTSRPWILLILLYIGTVIIRIVI